VRDLILPGEMKEILNQVIEAEKRSQANIIKRREETAAIRSQLNTVKMLEEHPMLARMKDLEALQEILQGANVRFVLGNGDLLGQLEDVLISRPDPRASS
jgi:regulator of protease activity HflC (stomatin/prohibitin superfamily)